MDGSGGIYVAGDFTSVGGTPVNYFVHLNSDYSIDTNWNPQAQGAFSPGYIYTMALSESSVFFGGNFVGVTFGGNVRNYIAKLDRITGSVDTSWNPTFNGRIYSLVVHGNILYVGGSFTR